MAALLACNFKPLHCGILAFTQDSRPAIMYTLLVTSYHVKKNLLGTSIDTTKASAHSYMCLGFSIKPFNRRGLKITAR